MEATTMDIDFKELNKSDWLAFKFEEIAKKISETVKPEEADVQIYVGLEHLDGEDIHIRRHGVPADVKGGKLRCYPGDVIFGKRRAYQRKAAIADFEGICSAHAFVFRANPKVIDPKLFPFFLHSDQFMHRMVDISVGGLSPTINWGDLRHQEFLLPPKEEQAKLAELLWAMDEISEKYLQTLENVRTAYVSIIENELLRKNSPKLFLREIIEVIRGVGYKPNQLLEKYEKGRCILLRANNIYDGKLVYDDINIVPGSIVKDHQYLLDGDFAICMSNGSKDLVGKCAEFSSKGEKVTIGSFCAGIRPKNEYNRRLIRHIVNSESYRLAIRRALTGSTINNLKPQDIEGLFFRVDLSTDKSELLNKLDSILKMRTALELSISNSKAIVKSATNQIFNGTD